MRGLHLFKILDGLTPQVKPSMFAPEEHQALDELGCCCTPGAEGCDSQIDVGAQVEPSFAFLVIF